MTEQQAQQQLEKEGFSNIYVWQDRPNAFYSDHTHSKLTAHIILHGEITITVENETTTFSAGERCDVPAKAMHSAQIGPLGCTYMVGEK